jgi:hypothetical protein
MFSRNQTLEMTADSALVVVLLQFDKDNKPVAVKKTLTLNVVKVEFD